jgi:hypothetical protein
MDSKKWLVGLSPKPWMIPYDVRLMYARTKFNATLKDKPKPYMFNRKRNKLKRIIC